MGACVALNHHHPEERRRWSLVHELGHFLRDRETGDVLSTEPENRRDPSEQFSEALTAEFLMPATGVRRRFAEHLRDKGAHFSAADLIAMARFHAVSLRAMTLRLEELQLLPEGTYQNLMRRNFRPAAAQAPLPKQAERWLPQRYERLALEAYSQELLSEGSWRATWAATASRHEICISPARSKPPKEASWYLSSAKTSWACRTRGERCRENRWSSSTRARRSTCSRREEEWSSCARWTGRCWFSPRSDTRHNAFGVPWMKRASPPGAPRIGLPWSNRRS
ncbi:ImmA/IrrE family metallo-endopeptidase [Cystobacter fuscus]